jgi:hypothetical protein
VTFKDLKKWLGNLQDSNTITANNNGYNNEDKNNNKESAELILKGKQFEIFVNRPFWIEDIAAHKAEDRETGGNCCFNHIIGLPKKDGVEKPIFDHKMQLAVVLDKLRSKQLR